MQAGQAEATPSPIDSEPSPETSDDWDSALGSETSSISETLSSSVMAYEFEGGRRYHAYQSGRYYLPNDELEASRLDLQHKVWLLTLHEKLFRAPIEKERLRNALDIGTGTGIWAIEFADEHPDCHIIGTDLSPIQPTWTPPNCEFLVDDLDASDEWVFPPMDFIHSRMIVASVRDWPRYIKRCYDALVPGGWLELAEVELPLHCDDGSASPESDPLLVWGQGLYDAGQKYGADFHCQRKLKTQMEEAGFINAAREDYQWPIGPYTGDDHLDRIGTFMVPNASEMMEATKAMFSRVLGWTEEEITIHDARVRQSVRDLSKHRYFAATVHYAQKPYETRQSVDSAIALHPPAGNASNVPAAQS